MCKVVDCANALAYLGGAIHSFETLVNDMTGIECGDRPTEEQPTQSFLDLWSHLPSTLHGRANRLKLLVKNVRYHVYDPAPSDEERPDDTLPCDKTVANDSHVHAVENALRNLREALYEDADNLIATLRNDKDGDEEVAAMAAEAPYFGAVWNNLPGELNVLAEGIRERAETIRELVLGLEEGKNEAA